MSSSCLVNNFLRKKIKGCSCFEGVLIQLCDLPMVKVTSTLWGGVLCLFGIKSCTCHLIHPFPFLVLPMMAQNVTLLRTFEGLLHRGNSDNVWGLTFGIISYLMDFTASQVSAVIVLCTIFLIFEKMTEEHHHMLYSRSSHNINSKTRQ